MTCNIHASWHYKGKTQGHAKLAGFMNPDTQNELDLKKESLQISLSRIYCFLKTFCWVCFMSFNCARTAGDWNT